MTSLYSSAPLKRKTGLNVLTEERGKREIERLDFLFFTLFIYSFGYEDEKEEKTCEIFATQKLPLILVCLRMNMSDTRWTSRPSRPCLCHPCHFLCLPCESLKIPDPTEVKTGTQDSKKNPCSH